MKALPSVEQSYRPLHDMAMAPIRSRLLMTGIDLGVFDELETFNTAIDVAQAIGAHAGNTERFLNALAMIELLEKKGGRFRNRPEANTYLIRSSATYLGDFLRMLETMCVTPLDDLHERVKEGPDPDAPEADFSAETLWAEVTRVSAGWVKGFVGPRVATMVSGLPEFSTFQRMLDLGGGHGMFALYFVDAHPTMTAEVFDRPSVVPVAADYARTYGLQDRVTVRAGDYLTDAVGSGYDFIWACATLNFARHDLDPLVAKIYEALNPGGVFISFQDGLTHERTRPDVLLGHLGADLHSGGDMFFNQGEIGSAMLRCGFRSVQSRTLELPAGTMDMDIARKS